MEGLLDAAPATVRVRCGTLVRMEPLAGGHERPDYALLSHMEAVNLGTAPVGEPGAGGLATAADYDAVAPLPFVVPGVHDFMHEPVPAYTCSGELCNFVTIVDHVNNVTTTRDLGRPSAAAQRALPRPLCMHAWHSDLHPCSACCPSACYHSTDACMPCGCGVGCTGCLPVLVDPTHARVHARARARAVCDTLPTHHALPLYVQVACGTGLTCPTRTTP